MQARPKLSIVIPSYQQAFIIRDALFSIAQQTFTDYEVLVIDALSKDNTREIVGEFKNNNISFISEKDNGIYDAMNKGIAQSKGEFLYFMGCDDKLSSNTILENIFTDGNNRNTDFIYGDVFFTKDNTRYDGKFNSLKLISHNICHQAIFTRRTVFEQVGLFNVKYKYLADWEFNMRCFADKTIIKKYVPIVVAYYNNDGSSFNNPDYEFGNDRSLNNKKYFSLLVRYLNNHRGPLYRLLLK